MLKRFSKISIFTLSFSIISPLVVAAQDYVSLSRADFLQGTPSSEGLPAFFNLMYTIGVSVASVLAIVYIFYAGFIYTTSSSSDGKSVAKRRIQAALGGLLLALGSYIILRTINPQLVYINLGFGSIEKGEIEAQILTEEARQNLIQQEQFLQQEESSYQSSINNDNGTGGSNAPQPIWNGSSFNPGNEYIDPSGTKSLKGIPIKGQSNPTAAKFGVATEQLTTSFVGQDGSLWARGKGSWFGGPNDHCVQPEPDPIGSSLNKNSCWPGERKTDIETTALYSDIALKRINVQQNYVALRFNYKEASPSSLKGKCLRVYSPSTGKYANAGALDWGPHPKKTDKSIDMSPGLFKALGYPMKGSGNDMVPTAGSGDVFYFRFIDGTCSINQ